MRRLGMAVAAVLLCATMGFARENRNNVSKEPFAINFEKLSNYLQLSSYQANEVANINEYFNRNATILFPVCFVAFCLFEHIFRPLPVFPLFGRIHTATGFCPGIRIVAIFAPHLTAFQKDDIAHARTVCRAKTFRGMNVSQNFFFHIFTFF